MVPDTSQHARHGRRTRAPVSMSPRTLVLRLTADASIASRWRQLSSCGRACVQHVRTAKEGPGGGGGGGGGSGGATAAAAGPCCGGGAMCAGGPSRTMAGEPIATKSHR
eukprot:196703-Chlamydomonas_euryale.AAC.2